MPAFALPKLFIVSALVLTAAAVTLWPRFHDATPSHAGTPQTHTIEVGDRWFCAPQFQNGICETVIETGDTVVWDFAAAQLTHTSTECGDSCSAPTDTPFWDSGFISDGSSFQFQFPSDQGGTYLYQCRVHPAQMRGRIVVQGNLPTPPGPPIVYGDVNCSGNANAIDAALILQLNAGLLTDLACEGNADVNGDGRVDSIDAVLVLQFVAGLLDTLPP